MADHASNRPDDYGSEFADYLEANNLGHVIRTKPRKNLYTNNTVRVWIWTPDFDALKMWREFNPPDAVLVP